MNLNVETSFGTSESLCGTSANSLETFLWDLCLGPLKLYLGPFNPYMKALLYLVPSFEVPSKLA